MRKFIPVEEVAKVWMKDPAFVAAYDALEDEFAMASALIKARRDADMTQEQVARAMGTTQAVVAATVLIFVLDFLITKVFVWWATIQGAS